tara:strand:- start:472 stop:1848 length:1377 start_codon:yes stop_codon:yes gene_type:complete
MAQTYSMLDSKYNAKKAIEDVLKKTKHEYNQNRKEVISKLIDYYNGDNTVQYTEEYFQSKSFQEVPVSEFNLTRRFVDKMSRVYSLGASRTVNKQSDYDLLTRHKDFKMKHIEKMTRLLGTIAVGIEWKEDANGQNYFEYKPIYNFDVGLDIHDPYTPTSITYPLLLPHDDPFNTDKVLYAYWDKEHYCIMDADGNIEYEEANYYGVLPFIFLHKDHQITDFFCYPAVDVMNANELINILFTEMNLGMRFQMFGQYAATGLYENEKIERAGSDQMIILPEGANIDILSPNSNIGDALKLARSIMEIVAQSNHLSISFSETNRDRPQSGIALKIKELESFQDYQDDLDLWSHYERLFFELEARIAAANGHAMATKFGVDFNEPEYPMSIQDEVLKHQFAIDNNLMTHAQILQKKNKDLTIEQAQKIVDENRETNGKGKEEPKQRIFSRLGQGITAAKQG